MVAAKEVDWNAIEADYRAGIKTLRSIAAEHHITHGAIRKRAARDGWVRDLAERIREKARADVAIAVVSKSVSTVSTKTLSEKQIIDANSKPIVDADLKHRSVLDKLIDTLDKIVDELDVLSTPNLRQALEDYLAVETEGMTPKQAAAMRKAFHAALGHGGRAASGRQLAAAISQAIDKQRQALGMDAMEAPETAWLRALKELRDVE